MTLPKSPVPLFDAYLFDLDGTIYLGDHLLPGVQETITELRRRGIPVRFLSNNPTKTPQMFADKLTRLGLPTGVEDVTNTIITTVGWLTEHHAGEVIFPIAEQPLCTALEAAGFELSDAPTRIDVVIASYDRGFDYHKLQIAFDALWFERRAILVQTNSDRYCPFPGGRGEPDCAAITAAIEASTGVGCSATFGKPGRIMVEQALHGLGVAPSRAVMVGDRLATDIAMGHEAGMASALVLTGDSTLDDVQRTAPDRRPDYVLNHLDELTGSLARS